MATRSRQGNAKSKPPNATTADVTRPTGAVDAALWEVIISIKEDTAATREYLANVNLRLEAMEAQNEEIVGNISALQTEMEVIKSTIKTYVCAYVRACVCMHVLYMSVCVYALDIYV